MRFVIQKFLILSLSALILYIKPLYFIIFILLFYWELFFFFNYVYNIFINYDDYYRIEVEEFEVEKKNILEIWIECCKLEAFCKLYSSLSSSSKKKFYPIIKAITIISLGIPYKFLKLMYTFIWASENIKDIIIFKHFRLYTLLKNCKIEIYEKKIFLNCETPGKLILKLKNLNPSWTKKEILEKIFELKNLTKGYTDFESKGNDSIRLKIVCALNEKKEIIYSFHHGHIFEKKNIINTIHATSNTNFLLKSKQYVTNPISNLILPNSIKPGCIISLNVPKIIIKGDGKIIKKHELTNALFEFAEEFDIENSDYIYIEKKLDSFKNVLEQKNYKIAKEFTSGTYDNALLNTSVSEFIKLTEELKIDSEITK